MNLTKKSKKLTSCEKFFKEIEEQKHKIDNFDSIFYALKDIVDDIEKGRIEWETNGSLACAKRAIEKAERK